MTTIPTKGRIVHYALSTNDVSELADRGHDSTVGDICPAIVVDTDPNAVMDVSLQVFLNGPLPTHWVRYVENVRAPDLRAGEPPVPGCWFWPPGSPSSPVKRGRPT